MILGKLTSPSRVIERSKNVELFVKQPKPDENSLLTDEEIRQCAEDARRVSTTDLSTPIDPTWEKQYLLARQRDLTASIIKAECRAKVERIKRKIEGKHTFTNDEWETLWKEERI